MESRVTALGFTICSSISSSGISPSNICCNKTSTFLRPEINTNTNILSHPTKRICTFGPCVDSEGPEQTARKRSLITAFSVPKQNLDTIKCLMERKCLYGTAHVQDDVNPHILRMLEGTFLSLDADYLTSSNGQLAAKIWGLFVWPSSKTSLCIMHTSKS